MEFAYIDESGDTGITGTRTFTLGCVLVPADDWGTRLDQLVSMRRDIRDTYGLPMRQEVKANHLVGVKKAYLDLGLGDGQVRDIYQRHLRATTQIASGVFAVVARKDLMEAPNPDVFDTSWRHLLDRLRKRSETTGAPILVIHDIGQDDAIRKLIRRFRRPTAYSRMPASLIVEDPVPRDSRHSYFIQLADLAAYAASSTALPRAGRTAAICDETMWQMLKSVHVSEVSQRLDGLYVFPSKGRGPLAGALDV